MRGYAAAGAILAPIYGQFTERLGIAYLRAAKIVLDACLNLTGLRAADQRIYNK
jgi:hypothetical protein